MEASSATPAQDKERPIGAGLTAKVFRGSSFGTAGQFAVLASAFIATPFLVRMLGAERYGVLALVSLVVGYFLYADLGMGSASTRFASEALGQQDRRREVAVVWTSLLLASLPAIAGFVTLVGAGRWAVVHLLRVSPAVQGETVAALRWAAFVFVIRILSGIFNTPQLAHLRIGTYTLINSGTLVLQTLLVPVVVVLGWGVAGAVEVMAGVNVIALGAHILVDLRILPEMRRPSIDRALIRPMFVYGAGIVANAVAELLFAHFDKLAVTRYISVKDFAYYSLGAAVAGLIVPIPLALFQSLVPAFTRMHAAGDSTGVELLLQRATKAVLLIAMPLLMVIVVGAHPFLTAWAGPEFAFYGSRTAYVLAAGQVVAIFGYVPSALLYALGKSRTLATLHWIELPLFLVAVILVTPRYGALGAAACWAVRCLVDAVAMTSIALRNIRPRELPLFGIAFWRVVLLGAIAGSPVVAKAMHAGTVIQLGLAAVALGAYGFVAWRHFLRADEREWMVGMAGIGRSSDATFKRTAARWLVVIVLVTGFAAHVARSVRLFHPAGGLLSDQPLLTDDNSMHSYYTQLGAKLIQKTGEPYGYVPDEMAGHPKTAIFDAGILPVEELMARVTFLSPFLVYKLFVLVSMLSVGISALLTLLLFRVRGAALCIGWFVLMFHYWWGQGLIFTMGGMNTWLLAASGALLLMGAIARLIEDWSPPMAVLAAFLFCLLPYLHPIAIVPVGLSSLVLIACSKGRRRALLFVICCGALSVMINWHWISNTMQNRAIATPLAEIAGAAEGPVRLLRETSNEIHGAVGLSKLINRVNVAAFNVAVVLGGLGGLIWLRRKKDSRSILLLVFVVVLGGLTYFSGSISALQNIQPWRLRYLFLLVCSVAIAVTLEYLLAANRAKRSLALLLGLFAAFYFFAFDARRDVPPLQVGLTPAQQSWVALINSTTDGRGRILAEDGPGYDGIGLAALHLGTHAQWIGGPYKGAYILYHRVNFIDGLLSGRDIASYSPQELSDFFRRYNVHWIFAWSKPAKEALSAKPELLRPEWEKDGHVLYTVISPTDSYFEKGSGELTTDLDTLQIKNAVSSGGSIVLRYRFYDGLVAEGAGGLRSFPVSGDPVGFIEIVGPGKDVTIHVRH